MFLGSPIERRMPYMSSKMLCRNMKNKNSRKGLPSALHAVQEVGVGVARVGYEAEAAAAKLASDEKAFGGSLGPYSPDEELGSPLQGSA